MKVSHEWLQEYIGESIPSAEKIEELLTFHAFEVEGIEQVDDDTVIDVDVLPNRSSDCLCHRGIARELASITGIPLVHDPLNQELALPKTDTISVSIADTEACPRFTAALITGIEVKESPEWLKKRLKAIGQRPINNIVDATNYVMFAIGQPLHAYDADLFPQVDGQWQFEVRYAKQGEQISLIPESGKEDRVVELTGSELLIVDASSDTPIGLAGVKGGRFAGVHAGTTKVIIEAAHFHPTITRQTARRLGIVIDASKRFENEPSRELPPYAQAEIIKLITDIAGGQCEGVLDEYRVPQPQNEVNVSIARTNALLGLSLSQSEIKTILERIGSTVTEADGGVTVHGPWERTDLNIEEEYIEEIGRLHGYTDVASVLPETVSLPEINKRHYYSEIIRELLISEGFSEVITSSFRNQDQIQLQNALASDKSYLRSSLSKNLAEVLDKNSGFTDLLGVSDTRVFEIGTVFTKHDSDKVKEHVALAIGIRLKQSGYTGKEDRPCDEILKALSTTLEVPFGAVSQSGQKQVIDGSESFVYNQGIVEINLSKLLEKLSDPTEYKPVVIGAETVYQPFSTYPHMSRDIAMWTSDGTTSADIEKVLNEHAGALRVRTTLFDQFTKDGKTSYAFRLVFQASDRTLTDVEVNGIMEKINAAVAALGWEVR